MNDAEKGQGFSAVSPEAAKYLRGGDEVLKDLDDASRQKFVLSKQTLAKRPAEFGPVKEVAPKKKTVNKKLVLILGAVILVLFVAIIIVIIVAGAKRKG